MEEFGDSVCLRLILVTIPVSVLIVGDWIATGTRDLIEAHPTARRVDA